MAIEPLHLIFVIGCTGCGKGAFGRALASRVDGEVLSVDSMKVYRGLDIGTAKPSAADRASVPHHLIDVVEPSEDFSVARFVEMAEARGAEIMSRGRKIIAVGGTAMYIKGLSEGLFEGPSADLALRQRLHERADSEGLEVLHAALDRVDPESSARIHRNDRRRIVRALEVYELTGRPISALQQQWDRARTKHRCTFIGLRRDLADQNHRTNIRVKRLIERGWVEEVRGLLREGRALGPTARQALGYRELIEHVSGALSLEEAVEKIKISTRQFAKAQRTWFKRFRGAEWFDLRPDDDVDAVVNRVLEQWESLCRT